MINPIAIPMASVPMAIPAIFVLDIKISLS
jgi:hypothetical protein